MKKSFSFLFVFLFAFTTVPQYTSAACPFDSNWSHYVTVTVQSSQVDEDVDNFPVYVDLSDLPADFFSTVKSDGGDIRVTDDTCDEVAREVVAIDTGANTGELHFKAAGTLSSGTNTEFRIYYGNSGASDYAPSATFGAQNVWTASYEGVWHMNAGSGNNESDSTANGNTLTDQNTVGTASGQLGDARSFAEENSEHFLITDANQTGLDNHTDMSWSQWINIGNSLATGDIYGLTIKFSGGGNGAYQPLYRNDGGTLTVQTSVRDPQGDQLLHQEPHDLGTSAWKYVVFTFDGSAQTSEIYVDGVSLGTESVGGVDSVNDEPNDDFIIGSRTGSEWFFDGFYDEPRVLSTKLSANWISTEYNNQNSPSTFYAVGAHTANDTGGDAVVPQRILYTWF